MSHKTCSWSEKNSPPAEKHICVLGEEKLAEDEYPTFFSSSYKD